MRTGKLRNRVSVKELSTTPDGAGGTTTTWTEILETWANVKPMKGQRLLEYGQLVQGTPYDVTLRFREDISVSKNLRIDFKGKEMILHSVINKDEFGKELNIVAYTKS